MMRLLTSRRDARLLGVKKARVSEEERQEAERYLLQLEDTPCSLIPKPILNDTSDTILRNNIYQQRQDFLTAFNMSHAAWEYCARCLNYLGDQCAKQSQPEVGVLAWQKMREIGVLPSEGTVSTFLYIFFDESTSPPISENMTTARSQASMEAITLYDTLFRSTEKTLALRVKMLVSRGDVEQAEQLIGSVDDDDTILRLRTFAPILKHYCDTADIANVSRIYRTMKSYQGVHMDADNYCMVLVTLANKIAKENSPDVETDLFHSIANDMAEDLMEISSNVAEKLMEGIQETAGCVATRVTITEGALCPYSGAKLRLFSLSEDTRRVVHDTLLDMSQVRKSANPKSTVGKRKFTPGERLRQFSKWLRFRKGPPFTVFIDGPNVAYFGHKELDWSYIRRMVQTVQDLGESPLVLMPSKYIASSFQLSTNGSMQELGGEERAIIQELNSTKQLYIVPSGSFDDYYWMIASVAEQNTSSFITSVSPNDDTQRFPGLRPLVVTNDQMRDHRLQLLEPRLFRRWSSCHFVNYWMSNETIRLYPADFYSREIQCNEATSFSNTPVWHIPVTEWGARERLCVGININSNNDTNL